MPSNAIHRRLTAIQDALLKGPHHQVDIEAVTNAVVAKLDPRITPLETHLAQVASDFEVVKQHQQHTDDLVVALTASIAATELIERGDRDHQKATNAKLHELHECHAEAFERLNPGLAKVWEQLCAPVQDPGTQHLKLSRSELAYEICSGLLSIKP